MSTVLGIVGGLIALAVVLFLAAFIRNAANILGDACEEAPPPPPPPPPSCFDTPLRANAFEDDDDWPGEDYAEDCDRRQDECA